MTFKWPWQCNGWNATCYELEAICSLGLVCEVWYKVHVHRNQMWAASPDWYRTWAYAVILDKHTGCRFCTIQLYLALADLGGAHPAHAPPPPRDPILSFWHTNFMKRSCLGSPRPPYEVHAPPTGNPGSATALYSVMVQVMSQNYRLDSDNLHRFLAQSWICLQVQVYKYFCYLFVSPVLCSEVITSPYKV